MLRRCIPFLALLVTSALSSECGDTERETFPALCSMLDRVAEDTDGLAQELHDWAESHGLLVDFRSHAFEEEAVAVQRRLDEQLPVVFAHGMGDSCFNEGFQNVVARVSNLLGGVYTTCIPTGKDQSEDTKNGYFLNMNANIDIFAEAVQADPQLANGFHAIGFSQGNNIIRGYIAGTNDPPVHTFLSINGVNAGVGAVPHCRPKQQPLHHGVEFSVCDMLMEIASKQAYNDFAQEHSFQANYWRDPRPSAAQAYKTYCQLAQWNNEVETKNPSLNENWAKTQKFVWVLALQDGMVWPKEGEWWGAPDPNDPFQTIKPMNETEWYQQDLFGLRTAQEAGKNYFESFDGDHLQFDWADFERWVTTYLTG